MEGLNNRLKNSGQSYEDLRISKRPLPHNSNAFGNYPSTLGPSKKKGETGAASGAKSSQTRPKFKPAITDQRSSAKPSTTVRPNASKPKPVSSDESSEDEMDLLSESSQHAYGDRAAVQKPVPPSRKTITQKLTNATSSKSSGQKHGSQSEDVYIDRNGTSHQYHPDYKPKPNKYANMSFKSKNSNSETKAPVDSSSSSRTLESVSNENSCMSANGPASWSPVVIRNFQDDVVDLTSSPSKGCDNDDVARTSPLSGKSANSNRAYTPTPTKTRQSKKVGSSVPGESGVKPTKERPKPVPIRKGALQAKEASKSRGIVDILGLQRAKPASPEPTPPRSKKTDASKRSSRKSNDDLKPAPFPLGSLNYLSQSETAESSEMKQSSGSSLHAKPFPLLGGFENTMGDSQGGTRSAKEKAQRNLKGKDRRIILTDDEDAEEVENVNSKNKKSGKALKPKAFPLTGTVLSPGTPSPRPSKRNSDYGSEEERTVKKSRKGKDRLMGSPGDVLEEGDSMSLAPHADPKTLCPFCDMSLPRYPSPLLLKLLEATKKKASSDPRPTNPLGLRAPLTTYIAVCRRHLFESKILPEAERKGWPKTIKWKKVSGRVLKMEEFLQAIIEDIGDATIEQTPLGFSDWEMSFGGGSKSGKGKAKAKRPRASCPFWVETMKEIEKKGLRAFSGVRGQYANFEKAQPGYYGEMGYVIIYQTLYNMFPPTEINPDYVSPLTPTEFLQRILVPEVALHLIMEDQDLDGEDGMKKALGILRDSSAYGVAMFPEDGGEWGENKRRDDEKMGEADLIVMERARRRRKELEEEEKQEEAMLRFQEEQERREKEKEDQERMRVEAEKARKTEPRRGRTERVPSVVREPDAPAQRSRPRPVPIKKSKTAMSSSSNPPSEDETHARWTWSRSRSTVSDDSDMEKDNRYRPSSEERRRSPSASEWSNEFIQSQRKVLSRAPSHDMARLSITRDDPPSDSSTRALVNGEGRSTRPSSRNGMKVDTSDSEVEFVDDVKTPIPNRASRSSKIDDEDTPKPNGSKKGTTSKEPLAPLEIARLRKEHKSSASKPGPRKNSQGFHSPSSPKSEFSWLLSSPNT